MCGIVVPIPSGIVRALPLSPEGVAIRQGALYLKITKLMRYKKY
jgi:hypothetical protein